MTPGETDQAVTEREPPEAYSKVQVPSLDNLLQRMQKRTSRSQRTLIKRAFHLAEDAHKFQKRLSGEPYIIHPLEVALILADFDLDHEVICAALLHDVIEDTNISHDYMLQEFGETITHLVDGVTKISKLKSQSKLDQQAGNIRKMILATTRDPRVILIKLADKLHNMRTLNFQKEEKRRRIAQEVVDIYAPLAGRLGIFRIKWELEDLAFYHMDPESYNEIKDKVAEKKEKRDERIRVASSILSRNLKENRIKASVEGRSKHFYSIYKKMEAKNKDFQDINDLTGIRLLVKDKQDCYAAIGIAHTLWNPVPGRFKDYIAVPKSNGYQSLHTTVIGPSGKPLEIQIRTFKMHEVAEYGIAAHWAYKEKPKEESKQIQALTSLAGMEEGEDAADAQDYIDDLKINLVDDEVYVFTPKGEIIAMAAGATVLDFAFRIHSELGLKCAGARIAERLVSIRTKLSSGDQVQVLTNPHVKPSLNWLKILTTPHARAKLRNWFRKNNLEIPEYVVPVEIPEPKTSPGTESPEPARPVKKALKPDTPMSIEWQGEKGMTTKFARCCSPLPGDRIGGFITRGQGISVHKLDCPSLVNLKASTRNDGRVIELNWSGLVNDRKTMVQVEGFDRPQIYLDMVETLARAGANILEAHANTRQDGRISNSFTFETDSEEHLDNIIRRLEALHGVEKVLKIQK